MTKWLFSIFLSLAAVPAFAQGWSGESEVGTDLRGGAFVSQYAFYDFADEHGKPCCMNFLARYFWVNDTLHRGEVAFGPTFRIGKAVLKLQPGLAIGANDEYDFMAAGVFSVAVRGHYVLYIADYKKNMQKSVDEKPDASVLYQKLFVALTKNGRWQLRAEHLRVGRTTGFLRLGGEYQHKLGKSGSQHLYLAPFYDPVVGKPGVQAGYRFF